MTDAELHDLAGAYALDALSDDERRRFERHLTECGACARQTRQLQEASAALASADPASPPPAMKDALMARLDEVAQERGALRSTRLDERRGGRTLERLAFAAAAALILVVAVLGVLLQFQRARVSQLQAEIVQLESVTAAPDVRAVTLTGDAGTATVLHSEAAGAVLVATGLSDLPDDRVYEIWLLRGDSADPAGLFRPEAAGRVVVEVTGDLSLAEAVAVTIEPSGGSPAPTSDPVLLSRL